MRVSIKEIKDGMRLMEDVFSKLGGIIYRKGTLMSTKDIEIFEAFGINKIEIEVDKEIDIYITVTEKDNDLIKEMHKQYRYVIQTIENIFSLASFNAQIPLMDLRKALIPLLKEEYLNNDYLLSHRYFIYDSKKQFSHHAFTVGILAYAIAVWMNLEQGERIQVAMAGALHNIGLSRVQDNIISMDETGFLADKSNEIKKHTLFGYQILKETKGLNEGVLLGVLQHHEREDGKGYPLKLKGNQIHIYAKIIAIADVLSEMLSVINYNEEYQLYETLDQLINDKNLALDLKIINILCTNIMRMQIGTKVKLSDDREGHIVHINQQYITRPIININGSLLNLLNEKKIFIKKIYN